MVKLLRKMFIKNYDDTNDKNVRKAHGVLAAVVGIVFNLILFGIKLAIGILTFSMSIISDAINNLSDMLSCFVNLIGFNIAARKADPNHPYGHERIEYIAGMITSFIIICVAIVLGYNAITQLINGVDTTSFTYVAFIILGISIVGKLLLGLIYRGLGKAIDSVSLKASMMDSFNDCISTGVVLVAALVQYFVPSIWWLDKAMSIIVAIFILVSGIKMTKETASPLVGIPLEHELVQSVISDVKAYDGVLGVHDVVFHSYGPTKIFATIHVEVDGYQDVFKLHDMIDTIENQIGNKYGIEITIHMDPLDTRSKEIPVIKEKLTEILKDIDERITFHDLRVVTGETHTNVVFDIVIPFEKDDNKRDVLKEIRTKVSEFNPKYNCVIKVDYDYNE